MQGKQDKVDRLEQAMAAATRAAEAPSVPDRWQSGVMASVRAVAAEQGAIGASFEWLVPRLAWASVAIAAICIVCLGAAPGDPSIDLIRAFSADPIGLASTMVWNF